ncbi:ABC transporter substrate-binding protein [Capillibacterium thermochitinicola]|uniref:ABC transporter substrate-binding protein n=1 Tax=Capillibacterium thermochitinicola TaxID=2699427 RepID=A0A8J6HZF5_9FIRM|nr:ABC transporter substrate-binding protein [Capillibacterium thermochitinicola]MBA2132735.1 ABC transporter substrate-binding protein [Capillibacterium thermochitinicola]
MRIRFSLLHLGVLIGILLVSVVFLRLRVDKGEKKAIENKVVVVIPQDPDYLDPHLASAAGTYEVMFNVYEGLLKPAPDGTLLPALAERYTVSADGLTYTFYLRPGVKFHNGQTVTTADVQYSLERLMGTRTGQPLSPFFVKVESVEVPDAARIILKLKEVDASLLSNLTTASIVPKDYQNLNTQPIGTGPFRFVEYRPGQRVLLEKFDGYWQAGRPSLDQVEFRIIPDREAALIALKNGAVDIYPRIDINRTAELGEDFSVLQDEQNLVQILAMNLKRKPFTDPRVRQAVNHAIDKDELIDLAAFGYGTKLGSGLSPAMPAYYEPGLEDLYPPDPEKARQLLAEAGYPNGFRAKLTVPSNYPFHVDTAQIIVEQLKKVGIEVEIELVEWAVWLQRVYQGRDYEMTIIGLAGKLDPLPILIRYTSDYANNFFNYANAEFDRLYQQAAAESDEEKRATLYKKAQRILAEDAAAVFLMDPHYTVALRKELAGYQMYPIYVQDLSTVHWAKKNPR